MNDRVQDVTRKSVPGSAAPPKGSTGTAGTVGFAMAKPAAAEPVTGPTAKEKCREY
jgi:hypothetical protein